MNKLTDAEIVKALECCSKKDCKQCPAFDEDIECGENTITLAIDLINRQKAEIERLTKKYSEKCISNKKVEWYAIIALREKCVEHQEFLVGEDNKYKGYVSIKDLDYIIDELEVRS